MSVVPGATQLLQRTGSQQAAVHGLETWLHSMRISTQACTTAAARWVMEDNIEQPAEVAQLYARGSLQLEPLFRKPGDLIKLEGALQKVCVLALLSRLLSLPPLPPLLLLYTLKKSTPPLAPCRLCQGNR